MIPALGLLSATFLMVGCGSDDGTQPSGNNRVALRVTSGIETRAVDNKWQTGDAIGIYMLDGSDVDTYANVRYTTQSDGESGTFNAAEAAKTIYLPTDGSTRDFIAYYPYSDKLTAANTVYAIDLTEQDDQPAIDFMVASKVTGKSRTDYTVPFVFAHKLSKIEMKIEPGADVTATDLAGITVNLTGQPTEGTFDVLASTDVTATSTAMTAITLKAAADGRSAEGIVFPSKDYVGMTLGFHTQGIGDYAWPLSESTKAERFEAGKKYLYTITVNKTAISVTSAITDWIPGNGTGDTGSAE